MDVMEASFISKNLDDTKDFALKTLNSLHPKEKALVIALSGDLGSGKTAFVKELAGLLGVRKDEVTSPTFVIEKIYKISHSHFSHLIHIDAYRLDSADELQNLGWSEITSDPKNLICVEWPERVSKIIPKDAVKINFEFVDETTRKMKIMKKTES
jgi:tRNA threonylcarbamoyladenosine biosynthesis protein TsaE